MKNANIERRINLFLNEADIDWKSARKSVVDAAEDIFGEVTKKYIDGIMKNVKKHKPSNIEAAVQIGINMLRSE